MATAFVADANFLLRLVQPSHAHHGAAARAARVLIGRGDSIVLLTQSLFEVYAVATRPGSARDGLGLSPSDGKALLDGFARTYPLQSEAPIFAEWERLVSTYGTSGKASHDARYVALMLVLGLTHILTFNGGDFIRYAPEGITVVDPQNV